jgi:hypothetical protein
MFIVQRKTETGGGGRETIQDFVIEFCLTIVLRNIFYLKKNNFQSF